MRRPQIALTVFAMIQVHNSPGRTGSRHLEHVAAPAATVAAKPNN
jgi:hypothetical protein